MDTISIVSTSLSGVIAVLSIIFSIITFSKNGKKDSNRLEARLTGMEKDILYIRESLDSSKEWRGDMEKRVERLERSKH